MAIRYKCKNCGKFVSKNATACKHCGQQDPAVQIIYDNTNNTTSQSDNTIDPRSEDNHNSFKWKKTLIISVICFIVGLCMARCIASDIKNELKQGEVCVFVHDDVGCVSKEANDKLLEISLNKDNYGVINMLYTGEAESISQGTRCVFLRDLGNGFCWVRVDSKFQSLIVPTASIKRIYQRNE